MLWKGHTSVLPSSWTSSYQLDSTFSTIRESFKLHTHITAVSSIAIFCWTHCSGMWVDNSINGENWSVTPMVIYVCNSPCELHTPLPLHILWGKPGAPNMYTHTYTHTTPVLQVERLLWSSTATGSGTPQNVLTFLSSYAVHAQDVIMAKTLFRLMCEKLMW